MANAKVTDLTELTTPAADDWLYVVDKSDTTDDADGSSRKIAVSNMLGLTFAGELSITGATTATIGRMHVCTGTSADYTVTLPAASGNGGKLIGFRMAGLAALSKFVTIDGNGSEKIDGQNTRLMWAEETAILLCDGSNWFKIAGKSRAMAARMGLSADQTGVVTATPTKVLLDRSDVDNTGAMVSTGSSQITVKRTGNYNVIGKIVWSAITTSATTRLLSNIYTPNIVGTQVASGEVAGAMTSGFPVISASDLYAATAGDILVLAAYQGSGGNANLYGAAGGGSCSMLVQEIPNW